MSDSLFPYRQTVLAADWAFDGWRPGAVLFDCDGTLVNSERCWTKAQIKVFARRGVQFRTEHKEMLIGQATRRMSAIIGDLFAEPAEQIYAELCELVEEDAPATVQPMPGAVWFATTVASAVPTAVVSNSNRRLLDVMLRCRGLDGLFDFTLAGDEVASPKPAPDMYRLACLELGVAPGDAVAVEDSLAGVRAANAAGLHTIGIPTLATVDLPTEVTVDAFDDSVLVQWLDSWMMTTRAGERS